MATAEQRRLSVASLVLIAIALIAAVMVTNRLMSGLRFDLTENKLYTLSDGTKGLLDKIDEPINLYFYYSDQATANIAPLRSYANRVLELLQEFEAVSDGNLQLSVIDPVPFSEEEDRAAQFGLQAVSIPSATDPIYLGLAGTNSVGDEEIISFFQPDKENFLEYDIAKLVASLASPKKTVIGLISGAPMSAGFDPATQQMSPGWVIASQVRQLFELRELASDLERIDDDISLLWIVQPKNLPEETLYAIDQFVLGGGNALIFVDPLAEADPQASNPQMPQMPSMGQSSNLQKLFDAWGIEYSPTEVVVDARLGLQVGGQGGRPVRHIGLIGIIADTLNREDVVTAGLDSINVGMAGHVGLAEESPATLEPLLASSETAATMAASRFSFLADPETLLDDFAPAGAPYVIGARISGTLPSAFPDGAPKPVSDEEEPAAEATDGDGTGNGETDPSAAAERRAHLAESAEPANLIVVADVDLLSDRLWVQVQNFFGQRIPSAFADNGNFVVNALENLAGSDDLISVRSRDTFARPFTRVEELRAEADARFRQTEQRLQAELAETERKLADLQSSREDTASLLLSPEQEAEIQRFIEQRARIRKELRAVQHDLDRNIQRLGTALKAINIGLVPLLLTLAGLLILWRNHRRRTS